MLSVASLLNPIMEERRQLPSPSCSSRCASEADSEPRDHPAKKPKLAKDAALFVKGKISGEINYAPYEQYRERIAKEVAKLGVYPQGKIADFRRHIPYNSDKKTFLQKTGREAFEGES